MRTSGTIAATTAGSPSTRSLRGIETMSGAVGPRTGRIAGVGRRLGAGVAAVAGRRPLAETTAAVAAASRPSRRLRRSCWA
jgi:hypothetical protein